MTTASLVDSAEGARSIAEQIAEKLAASAARGNAVPTASRSRRKSESAATALNTAQFERGVLDAQASVVADTTGLASAPNFSARSLSTVGSRPRSTLSLSSTSSLDTDASLTKSTNAIPYAGASQSRNSIAGPTSGYIAHSSNLSRSRRFRKELRSANLGSSMALPQLQLDTASASALNTSTGPGSHYSHRPSSSLHLHLDKTASVHLGAPAMYHSHPLSHSSSRLGTTPFSPIQEVAPSLQGYTSSPEQVMRNGPSKETFHKDDSLPPTPRDLASAAGRPWSQPTP